MVFSVGHILSQYPEILLILKTTINTCGYFLIVCCFELSYIFIPILYHFNYCSFWVWFDTLYFSPLFFPKIIILLFLHIFSIPHVLSDQLIKLHLASSVVILVGILWIIWTKLEEELISLEC
jgi:hypothetical protein